MLTRTYRDFDAFAGTVIDSPVGKTQDLTLASHMTLASHWSQLSPGG